MNIDKNFSNKSNNDDNTRWVNPLKSDNVNIYGLYWHERNNNYNRLPISKEEEIYKTSQNVNILSKNTSGGQLHFITNSKKVSIRAKVEEVDYISSMTPIAKKGFDCYVGSTFEDVKFYASTLFNPNEKEYEYTFFDNNKELNYVIINMPLYASVTALEIGIDKQSIIKAPNTFKDHKRIVVYGTSITQGGCASRPGLSYTNILSRKMKREWINFGFSGNAFGESQIMEILTQVKPAEMFIIDYEANAGTNGLLEKTLENLIEIIRKNQPKIEIVILSRIPYLFDVLNPVLGKERKRIRDFQEKLVRKMNENQDQRIHFIDGSRFFGDDFHEFTIDSIHPNDLGFQKIVESLEPKLNTILNNRR